MPVTDYIEVTISWLFSNFRGRDDGLFITNPAFKSCSKPTIAITSPDCGETNAQLGLDYTHDGAGKFPELSWQVPGDLKDEVQEWLLVSEDPDAPLPSPIVHGIYGGIPPTRTFVVASDFAVVDESKALLNGGFHYGVNRRGSVYIPPRPLLNHGVHRYFFFIVGLSEPLDQVVLAAKATREQIVEEIQGKVIGWGQWVGKCERVWK